MRLRDQIAIVTGASMGIGAATARILARRGATVWAVARSQDRLDALASQHPHIHPLVADVCLEEDRDHIFQTTGPVDILVNNAGAGIAGLVETMTPEQIRHLFELNVIALIDLTQRALSDMLVRGQGHICNVGSSINYLPGPPFTVYAATKFAVEGFTDGLRREVARRGVGVSLIQPGPVKTAFWDRAANGDRHDVRTVSGDGIPAHLVALAIARAISHDNLPGYATIAVPRPLGMGRLLDLPGVSLVMDHIMGSIRRTASLPVVDEGPDADVIPLHREDDTGHDDQEP